MPDATQAISTEEEKNFSAPCFIWKTGDNLSIKPLSYIYLEVINKGLGAKE